MNHELERLIELALMDGVIQDKEKVILIEKARKFGVQLDELEMIIDAKILEKSQNMGAPNSEIPKKKTTSKKQKPKEKVLQFSNPSVSDFSDDSVLYEIYKVIKFLLRGIYNVIRWFLKILTNIFKFIFEVFDGVGYGGGCFPVIIIMILLVVFLFYYF